MAKKPFTRTPCWVCQRPISNAGVAFVSHMRMHVREGKVEEIRAKSDGWYSYRRKVDATHQQEGTLEK